MDSKIGFASRRLKPEEFEQNVLPRIVQDKKSLHAVFASYNEIDGFKNGPVKDCKPGLSISIAEGTWDSGPDAFLLANVLAISSGNFEAMKHVNEAETTAGRHSYNAATEGVIGETINQSTGLLVAYMGLSAQQPCIDLVKAARKHMRAGHIAIITCDCSIRKKISLVDQQIPEGIVDSFVVTRICGGVYDMGTAVRRLMELWAGEASLAA